MINEVKLEDIQERKGESEGIESIQINKILTVKISSSRSECWALEEVTNFLFHGIEINLGSRQMKREILMINKKRFSGLFLTLIQGILLP